MKVVLIHGWLSSPDQNWFPWLKRELKGRGFEVIAPQMPHPMRPDKHKWVPALKALLKDLDPTDTILVGHSLGVPTILYCLQDHEGPAYAKVVLVCGFGRKIPFLDDVIDNYDMRLDMRSIRRKASEWICIHGDNDPLVPFGEGKWLAKKLGAEFIVENGRGHLTQYQGTVRLPSALKTISGELEERFRDKKVLIEELGMKLESVLKAIGKMVNERHPGLKIDPAIFLRSYLIKEKEKMLKRRKHRKAKHESKNENRNTGV